MVYVPCIVYTLLFKPNNAQYINSNVYFVQYTLLLIYCAIVGLNNKLITSVYVNTCSMLTTLLSLTSSQMVCMDNQDNSVHQVTSYTSRGKAITVARQAFGKYTPVHMCSRQTVRVNLLSWLLVDRTTCTVVKYARRGEHSFAGKNIVNVAVQFPLFPSRVQVKLYSTPQRRMGALGYISRQKS